MIVLKSSSATPNATVAGFGIGFSPSGAAVQVHFSSGDGPTLWSGVPGGSGAFAFSFTVPNVSEGAYRVVATQNDSQGNPIAGTPVTAPLRVSVAITSAPASPAPSQDDTPPTQIPVPVQQQQQLVPQPAPVKAAPVTHSVAAAPPPAPAAAAPAPPPAPIASQPTPLFRPPQVSSLWRVGGAVPQVSPTMAPIVPASADPPVLLLAIDVVAMCGAVVVIALALQPQAKRKPAAKQAVAVAAVRTDPAPPTVQPAAPARRGFMFSDW